MNYIASDASMFCSASGIAALLFCADFALTSNQLAKAELTRAAVLEQSVCLVAGYQHDSTVSAVPLLITVRKNNNNKRICIAP